MRGHRYLRPRPAPDPDSGDPTKHVVVLMLENWSFDQMLGAFQSVYPDLNGIPPNATPRINLDAEGNEYQQRPTKVMKIAPDPHHDLHSVLRQIGADPAVPSPSESWSSFLPRLLTAVSKFDLWGWMGLAWKSFLRKLRRPEMAMMSAKTAEWEGHFVSEFKNTYKDATVAQCLQVMGYYEQGVLPALHELADHFTICDAWFSSVPGPTWANRIFFHCGSSRGVARMPHDVTDLENYSLYDQRTIYDELNDHDVSWRIYFHDIPQSLALSHQWPRSNRERYSLIEEFDSDVKKPAEKFPQFVFIEPQYMGEDANDDHPPHDAMLAQQLIARVYNGIRANEALWNSTVLIIVYDEHGGFFDHINPPEAPCPDEFDFEYDFKQFGVRVPALLVSPWVERCVFSDRLDHTSIGKYLCDKWGLNPLGARMKATGTFKPAISRDSPRTDAPPRISAGPRSLEAAAQSFEESPHNENQQALSALSQRLQMVAAEEEEVRTSRPRVFATAALSTDPTIIRRRTLDFLQRPGSDAQ